MKAARVLLAFGLPVIANAGSPIGKVLEMVGDLQAKVIKEGEVAQKEYAEFAEWCEDRSRNLGFEIKTGQSEAKTLKASIAQETSTIGSLTTKIEELASSISTDEADLKAANHIRDKEASVFAAEEKDLVETVDMLRRATLILEREMQKGGGASMLQTAGSLAQAFSTMVAASMIGTRDAAKLTAFAQESQKDEDEAPGAPAGAVYSSQSGGIVDTLQDLTDKAETQLSDLRNRETANQNNFQMLKQALEDELANSNKEMDESKNGIAESSESKASAEGNLGVTSKALAEDVKAKSVLHQDCMSKASAFEAETKSRGEELEALATAKKIIIEATGGAASFLQVSQKSMLTSGDLHKYEAVRLIRDLAQKQHSTAMVQLASQMEAAMHASDGFKKIKGLIRDMIAKLESEAEADATKKAWCDRQLADSNAKKNDKTDEIAKLTTKIDQMSARSAQLKDEVATLQAELAKLAKAQANMDKIRQEEKTTYGENKAELEKGITGIQAALKVLTEYYASDSAHSSADGAAGGIIGLLEVCEADFSKNLAQVTADEEAAVNEYETVTKENEIEKTTKDQDVRYKTKESKDLDKSSAELNSDRSGVQAELDATNEYLTKLDGQCIAKAETYAERKERRAAEIAGLKEALNILATETALVQQHVARRTLRGATLSAA